MSPPPRLARAQPPLLHASAPARDVHPWAGGPGRAAEVWAATLAVREEAARRGEQPIDVMLREHRRRVSKQNEIGDLIAGLDGSPPDSTRVRTAIGVLSRAAAHAPIDHRPTLLCVLAWLHWALGLGTCAGRLLDSAFRIDPHHELTALVNAITLAVVLPHWVLDRDLRDETADGGDGERPSNRADRRRRRRSS